MNARTRVAGAAPGSALSLFLREGARVLVHPASFCAACYLAIAGNAFARSMRWGPGREVAVDALWAATLAIGFCLLSAARGRRGEGAFWGTLRPPPAGGLLK